MNPEVLVLQRPLHHYDADTAKMVLGLLKAVRNSILRLFSKEHVANRGLALPAQGREHRRPRTCFFTVEEKSQAIMSFGKGTFCHEAEAADVIWRITDGEVHAVT